jgi:hypothetical protein
LTFSFEIISGADARSTGLRGSFDPIVHRSSGRALTDHYPPTLLIKERGNSRLGRIDLLVAAIWFAIALRVLLRSRTLASEIPTARLELFSYLKTNTPIDSVILSTLPEQVFLYTNRRGFPLAELDDVMAQRGGDLTRLNTAFQAAGHRPVFLVGSTVQPPDQEEELEIPYLLKNDQFIIKRRFTSTDNTLWLATIDRRDGP